MSRVACIADPIAAVIDTARMFVGIREEPGNRGAYADFFNWLHAGSAVGHFRPYPNGLQGAPWCATFLHTAGRLAIGQAWPFLAMRPVPAMSSVQAVATWAAERRALVPAHDYAQADPPCVGDLLCLRRGSRFSHIALVQHVIGVGRVRTIEGNTNDTGSAEGIGVFELERTIHLGDALIRWTNLLPAGEP